MEEGRTVYRGGLYLPFLGKTDVLLRIKYLSDFDEEETKIYFCGWRRNAVGQNVRDKNLEKTRSAFGDAKAEMCKRKNISSCWTDCASDEDLKKLNDIVGM